MSDCSTESGCVRASCTGNNSAPDMTQFVNLTVGQSFTHPTYCEYCTQSSVNCGNNGEFTPNGNGIGKCKCRALCTPGCCRKQCTRTTYSGTTDMCCANGGPAYYVDSSNIVRTCDPQYRANNWINKTCDQSMDVYCQVGENLFSEACRQWVTTFQPTGSTQMTGNGAVDDVLLNVCNRPENVNRPECGCVVAANLVRQKLPDVQNLPVQCMMNMCANQPAAYRTSDQMGQCTDVVCEMSISDSNFVTNNPNVFSPSFVQQCGSNQSNTNNNTGNNQSNTNSIVGLIARYWWIPVIIILVVAIIIGIILYKK